MTFTPALFGWENWIGDYTKGGLSITAPKTKQALIDIVELAVADGKRLRAIGAGHSTTSVARPDHILVSMDAMQGTLPLDYLKDRLAYKPDNLVRLHAGTRLKYANRVLLGDKAVANMGSFDWQTLIGAISTGTHGSSIHTGPMADSVRSIEMVTVMDVDGEPQVGMRRIEPTDGITDRASFDRAFSRHKTELIQDDDTFYSAVVSFGSMGLVYSLTLEVLDEYWLTEKNEAVGWNEVKRMLRLETLDGFDYRLPAVLKNNDFWEFLVNAPEVQGKNTTNNPICLVRSRNRRGKASKPGDWKDKHDWPPRRIKSTCGQYFAEDYVRPKIGNESGKVLGIFDVGKKIRKNFEKTADKAPFEGDLSYSRNYWVLRRERDTTKPQEEPDPPPEAISHEIAVPLDKTIQAVEMILDIMARNQYFYAVPFGVRFVAPSPHYLAMQYDRPTCMIEVPMLLPKRDNNRAEDMGDIKKALEALEKALCYAPGHLGGRPHWGQYNCLTRENLPDLYDKLPVFESIYAKHNAFGTFDNLYTRQIGLKPNLVPLEEEEESEVDWTPLRIATAHVL